jgi:hypothetical protein
VCEATGKLADRLHLLCLPQPFLGRPLLGPVAGDLGEPNQFPMLIADGIDDDVGPEVSAVLANAPTFAFKLSSPGRGRDRPVGNSVAPVFIGIKP